jgi:hypothetical protein
VASEGAEPDSAATADPGSSDAGADDAPTASEPTTSQADTTPAEESPSAGPSAEAEVHETESGGSPVIEVGTMPDETKPDS